MNANLILCANLKRLALLKTDQKHSMGVLIFTNYVFIIFLAVNVVKKFKLLYTEKIFRHDLVATF